MLTDRQKLILKAIIEEYVTSNEPVGSKALTEKPYLSFSSATLRNEMQELEEIGYLRKTHTSSGRIPSDVGYRYYLDHLFIRDENVEEYYKYVDEIFDNKYLSKEESCKKLVNFISDLTGYYCAIVGNSSDSATVLRLEIVPLEANEAVLLIVTSAGLVQHQKIYIPKGYNMDDLMRIINMFDTAMYGHSIYDIRDILSREASKPRIRQMVNFQDDILNFMIKAFERFLHGSSYDAGLSKLLNQPEFQDYQQMQKLIRAIDGEEFSNLLTDTTKGVEIVVGSENKNEGFSDCSVVSVPFFVNDSEFGSILLVGPTRMNYRATVPLIEYVARSMAKLDKR
ncbi:MAG: heat-inducible transcriptional repressor HrcA [Acholeplasmatales bacterium]|nr:heat-inducible transcriptional repressor HrcA [Acholeplasmatales bacterium]